MSRTLPWLRSKGSRKLPVAADAAAAADDDDDDGVVGLELPLMVAATLLLGGYIVWLVEFVV